MKFEIIFSRTECNPRESTGCTRVPRSSALHLRLRSGDIRCPGSECGRPPWPAKIECRAAARRLILRRARNLRHGISGRILSFRGVAVKSRRRIERRRVFRSWHEYCALGPRFLKICDHVDLNRHWKTGAAWVLVCCGKACRWKKFHAGWVAMPARCFAGGKRTARPAARG